jgi:uncharacterized protein (DUF362 family)
MSSPTERRLGGVPISRREFIAATAVAPLLASACGREAPFDAAAFRVPAESHVALLPADSYRIDFADLILRGLRELRVEVRGKRVLLKPNLVEYEPGTAINTNPLVVAGAASALLSAGAREVVVGEGPGHRRDIEYLLVSTGLLDQLRDHKLRFVDLNHDDVRDVPLRSRYTGLKTLAMPVELLQADLVVSMPKLKTHHWAGVTCGMKNLFGAVPGAIYGWPKNLLHMRGIGASILDLNATIAPALVIVDAVMAMEGDGPIMGSPRALGFVAMGTDAVAVDGTCSRVIGLDPDKLAYLHEASRYLGNLDEARIRQVGEPPSRYATQFDVIEAFKLARLSRG